MDWRRIIRIPEVAAFFTQLDLSVFPRLAELALNRYKWPSLEYVFPQASPVSVKSQS